MQSVLKLKQQKILSPPKKRRWVQHNWLLSDSVHHRSWNEASSQPDCFSRSLISNSARDFFSAWSMPSISQLKWTALACSRSCWHALQPMEHWISCRVESSDALQSVWGDPRGGHGSTAALVLGKINPARSRSKKKKKKKGGEAGKSRHLFLKRWWGENEMQRVGGNKKMDCCWILLFPCVLCGLLEWLED